MDSWKSVDEQEAATGVYNWYYLSKTYVFFFILFIIYIYWLNIINNSTFCYISFDINEFSPDFTANRDNAPFDKGMTWNSEINIE